MPPPGVRFDDQTDQISAESGMPKAPEEFSPGIVLESTEIVEQT